ncbi:MAG: hydrogenase expression/formation protein HypE [Thermoplasmata archaeon]
MVIGLSLSIIMEGDRKVSLEDGAGGELMDQMITKEILPLFRCERGEIPLEDLDDSAVLNDLVFTIDSHTVKPIFFNGGNIGTLSICGTINDILALGGQPVAIASALVLPEGFRYSSLKRILKGAAGICEATGVPVLAGDTKVVGREDMDEPIMTTSAVGKRHQALDGNLELAGGRRSRWLSDKNLNIGDKIIVSGSIGDHGMTILSEREGYGFQGNIKSDVAPLLDIMDAALSIGGVAAAKDPTRGGLANALNEWARKSEVGIVVQESAIPLKPWVKSAGEMLGIDPLNVGNEGKMIIAVHPSNAEKVLKEVRKTENGKYAKIIGEVVEDVKGVVLETEVGGKRILDPPMGDPVPRIC